MSRMTRRGLLKRNVSLAALTLSAASIVENSASATVVGAINGRTAGSTLTLTDTAGSRFAISGTDIVAGATSTDYEAATSHNITIRETLAGATNTPRDTTLTITVTDVSEAAAWNPSDMANTALSNGNRTAVVSANGFVRAVTEHSDAGGGRWRVEWRLDNDPGSFNVAIGLALSSGSMPADLAASSGLRIQLLNGGVTHGGSGQTGIGACAAGDVVYVEYDPDGSGANGLFHYGKVGGGNNTVGATSAGPYKPAVAIVGSPGDDPLQITVNTGQVAFAGTATGSAWG